MATNRCRFSLYILGSLVLFLGPGCTSSPSAPEPGKDSAASESELTVARRKVRVAELQLDVAKKARDEEAVRKTQELELARSALRQFDEMDAPERLARERLSLTRSRDDLSEQEEELAQLEMTYAEVDLADKTREIVLQRNHRRVERAKEELALAERAFAKLEQHALPHERAELALAVADKTDALESARRSAEIDLLEKETALDEARSALAKLEADGAEKAP